jgi:hypothetical protein
MRTHITIAGILALADLEEPPLLLAMLSPCTTFRRRYINRKDGFPLPDANEATSESGFLADIDVSETR